MNNPLRAPRMKIDVTQFARGMECYPCRNFDKLSDDRPLTEYIKPICGQSFTDFAIKKYYFRHSTELYHQYN